MTQASYMRESIFVVTSFALKIHRASGPGRGKPVLISNWLVHFVFTP